MTFLLANWKSLGALALLVVISLGSYKHGVDTTTTKYELQNTKRALAEAKAALENKLVIDTLRGEKDVAQKRIDDLAADNKRYRVLLPGCGRIVPSTKPDAAGGSAQAPAGGESLPESTEGAQVALDAFMGESDADAYAADSLVNECRMVYKWAKDLGR